MNNNNFCQEYANNLDRAIACGSVYFQGLLRIGSFACGLVFATFLDQDWRALLVHLDSFTAL